MNLCKYAEEPPLVLYNSSEELNKEVKYAAKKLWNIDVEPVKFKHGGLERRLAEEKGSVVVSHYINDHKALRALTRFEGTPVLYCHCSAHISGYFGPNRRQKNRRKLFSEIEKRGKVIGVSEYVKETFSEIDLFDFGHVVWNGVETSDYVLATEKERRSLKRALGIDDEKTLISYAGRLTELKGVHILGNILHLLENDEKYKDFAFVGALSNGMDRLNFVKFAETCENLIDEGRLSLIFDLSKYIDESNMLSNYNQHVTQIFENGLKKDKLPDYTCFKGITTSPIQEVADVYVQPSMDEACPLSPIEAVVSGTPIIVSDVGGMSEMFDEGFGKRINVEELRNLYFHNFARGISSRTSSRVKELSREAAKRFLDTVGNVADLERKDIREKAITHFSSEIMRENFEKVLFD